jgi:hypothetical protein
VIVELLGPPGSDKTTFAVALGQYLAPMVTRCAFTRARGRRRGLGRRYAQDRPNEWMVRTSSSVHATGTRTDGGDFRRHGRCESQATSRFTVSILPHSGIIGALRAHQYVIWLSTAWRGAQSAQRITFSISALCSGSAHVLSRPEMACDHGTQGDATF